MFGHEAAHQKRRQDIDILLQGCDIGLAELFFEPAAQRLDRPDIGDPLLLLHVAMRLGQDRQRTRLEQAGALGKADVEIDGIGAVQLQIELMAGLNRVLLVGRLVGEPVTGLEAGIEKAQDDHHGEADGGVDAGPAQHPLGDPVAEDAQAAHACVIPHQRRARR